jgi:hypothetical protein
MPFQASSSTKSSSKSPTTILEWRSKIFSPIGLRGRNKLSSKNRAKNDRQLLDQAEKAVNGSIARRASTQSNIKATRESIAKIKANGRKAAKA